MYTCAIRKVSSGYRITAFQGDNLQHLHSICVVLLASPNYSGCYIVCTDWQNNVLFNLQPQPAYAPSPGAGLPMQPAYHQAPQQLQYTPPPQYAPAPTYAVPPPPWNSYYQQEQVMAAQQALPPYRRPAPPPSHTRVIDAEFEVVPALPAYYR
jgi:hypothetical protein